MLRRYAGLRSLLVVTTFACLLLAGVRIAREVSFSTPLQRPTTGFEEEPLFHIWKVTQHQPVYADPFAPPYAGTLYNWLFYATYGSVATGFLNGLGLASEWLPTITRFLTALFAIACAFAFWFVAKEGELWPRDWGPVERICLATIAIWNPLSGFFVFSARPDMAALLFELLGLAFLLRYLRTKSVASLVVSILTLFCAWSFKPTSAFVLAGIILWLVLSKRFRDATIIALISVALYVVVFLVGGKYYAYAILSSQATCEFRFAYLVSNLEAALPRSPFLIAGLLIWLIAVISRSGEWRKQARNLLGLCFIVSFVCYSVISTKRGAGSNYFITPSVLAMLWLMAVYRQFAEARSGLILGRTIVAVVAMVLLGSVLPFAAQIRHHSAPAEHQRHRELAQKLASLEAPILVDERFDNLPWIQRKPPYFVYSFAYRFDRIAGRDFVSGGLGGLIRAHYFKTIVFRNEPQPVTGFDEASFDGYERLDSRGGYDFYVLRENDKLKTK